MEWLYQAPIVLECPGEGGGVVVCCGVGGVALAGAGR